MKDWKTCTADVVKLMNKHYTSGRSGKRIEHIVLHYNAADGTVENVWDWWQTRKASAHYQVESSGRIGQLVWDRDTAWHAGNWAENCRSIGIEHANRKDKTVSAACLDNGAHLVAALCLLYGLGRPQWHVNVFEHEDFAATDCAASLGAGGSQHDEYMRRAQKWYDEMTGSGSAASASPATKASVSTGYLVKVTADALNVREGPGTGYRKVGCITDHGTYTIVEERDGWGRVKSGLGWISLAYTSRSGGTATAPEKSVDEVAREVIAGRWGNGTARRDALRKAGYDYAAVQARVNELLR